jgi:hypothetical protein
MTTTGRFSPIFRTGQNSESPFEQILESLNQARGTAYASYDITKTDTAVYVENYALAKAINDLWETNQRLANQFDPTRMGAYLDRWETILGIVPNPSQTIEQRKAVVGAKMALLANAPIHQAVDDLCRAYLGDLYVGIINSYASENVGGVPGGAVVPGGVSLLDDLWFSPISVIAIRTWQIRDKFNNYLYDERDYVKRINELSYVLDGFLPSYMLITTFRFIYQGPGTISTGVYDYEIEGVGTSFDTDLTEGDTFETVDDNNELHTYTVAWVNSATSVHVIEPVSTMTGCFYRIFGFYLDYPGNLDTLTFGSDPPIVL